MQLLRRSAPSIGVLLLLASPSLVGALTRLRRQATATKKDGPLSWTDAGCEGDVASHETLDAAIMDTCLTDPEDTSSGSPQCQCLLNKAHHCYDGECKEHLGGKPDGVLAANWRMCMAKCFPSPSCEEMCDEAPADCKTNCINRYAESMDTYKTLFARVEEKMAADAKAAEDMAAAAEEGPPPEE